MILLPWVIVVLFVIFVVMAAKATTKLAVTGFLTFAGLIAGLLMLGILFQVDISSVDAFTSDVTRIAERMHEGYVMIHKEVEEVSK